MNDKIKFVNHLHWYRITTVWDKKEQDPNTVRVIDESTTIDVAARNLDWAMTYIQTKHYLLKQVHIVLMQRNYMVAKDERTGAELILPFRDDIE